MYIKTPYQIYGELFEALHKSGNWKDGKLISDAIPKSSPEFILSKYRQEKVNGDFDLRTFFESHFVLPTKASSDFESDSERTAEAHIYALWDVLTRAADKVEDGASLIGLPHDYVVPGGRFNEIYYWDSYFTIIGLGIHGKVELVESMIDNFAWLIDTLGFIPNGNRSYFTGRSQPPFFAQMVEHLASITGLNTLLKYKAALVNEHSFWMDDKVDSVRRCIQLEDGCLNRYHDLFPRPREEMYMDDLDLLAESGRDSKELFADVRAACESGWDFSSRWFSDFKSLSTIRCADVIPVDLNCLLYSHETLLVKIAAMSDDKEELKKYTELAEARRLLIQKYFWNESLGFFSDYDFKNDSQINHYHLGGIFPLYFQLATKVQAASVAEIIEQKFLKAGGVLTTTIYSGHQWDAPNGWAPLQWMTVMGLDNYGFDELAKTIASRWVAMNDRVYKSTGKFVEKYNVENMSLEAGGGEYPVQDGFGWSNGVYLAMKNYLENK